VWSFINADEEEEILVVVAVDRDSGRNVIIETGEWTRLLRVGNLSAARVPCRAG
jgi:hypothetical protein